MRTISKKIGSFEIINYYQHDLEKNRYIILENGFDCIGNHFSLREVITVFRELTSF